MIPNDERSVAEAKINYLRERWVLFVIQSYSVEYIDKARDLPSIEEWAATAFIQPLFFKYLKLAKIRI